MAIDKYYKAQKLGGKSASSVAAPKIIIDMMLMEKYHWTPQQIDEIPKTTLDMLMLAINEKFESEAGIEKIRELEKEHAPQGVDRRIIGGGGIRQRRQIR